MLNFPLYVTGINSVSVLCGHTRTGGRERGREAGEANMRREKERGSGESIKLTKIYGDHNESQVSVNLCFNQCPPPDPTVMMAHFPRPI